MDKNWTASKMPRLDGKRAVVTGGNAGIGYHLALELSRAGAEVVIPARDAARGNGARERILAEAPGARVTVESLDLASLASVRAFAGRMRAEGRPLDLLLNNAGIMSLPTLQLTEDGYERQFGTNHLGHFALTGLLLPLLLQAPGARVVTVSSGLAAFARIDFDDLQSEKRYRPQGAYEVSKLANLYFTLELDRRAPPGLVSVAAHPGVAATDLPQSGPRWLYKRIFQHPSRAALSPLYAAVGAEVRGGEYYGPCGPLSFSGPPTQVKYPKRALDEATARELWRRSEALTGVTFDLEVAPLRRAS